MGKREFYNRMSLRGADNIKTVIAPSGYARSSDFQVSSVIKGLIGRSLDDCLRNRGMTFDTVILGQQRVTRVSKDVKWTHGSSPRVTSFKRGMTFIMWILISSTSMTGTVRAECVPSPSCVEIGYNATSCSGDSLKCPFDITKMKCMPCDTSFKYDCSGTGYSGGDGISCDGKYMSCTCSGGYEWKNGACTLACATSYQYECTGTGYSGGNGTACGGKFQSCTCTSDYEWKNGVCSKKPDCNVGYIYYSDKSCSSSYDSSKTVAGIVVKKNELIMSKPTYMTWSSAYTNTSLTDMSQSQAKADMNGKSNTAVIVAAHPSETTSSNAAIYCNSYTGGISGTSSQWYLPAAGELYTYVYGNYSTLNPVATTLSWSYFSGYYFWSSSEYTYSSAWSVDSTNGTVVWSYKNSRNSFSCLLAL